MPEIKYLYLMSVSNQVCIVLYTVLYFYGPFSSHSVWIYIRNSKTAELSTDFKLKFFVAAGAE
jgi:hypothetical protein